jgi:hypothetical protein
MAVKNSDAAKEQIIAALTSTYTDSAMIDKKLYINVPVLGEIVQIAVTLTAPKVKVEFGAATQASGAIDQKPAFNEVETMKEVEKIFDFFNIK